MCNTKKEEEFQTAEEFQLTGEARRDHDIELARKWLKEQPIKKSGYNRSLNYRYFEFDDIIGPIQEACLKYDLSTHFTIESIDPQPCIRPSNQRNEPNNMPTYNGIGLLEIKSQHYHIPREVRVPLCYMLVHQEIGKAVNYCKRYAYMLGFEISEVDLVDMDQPPKNDIPRQWKTRKQNKTVNTKEQQANKQKIRESTSNQDQSTSEQWKEEKIIKSLHNKMKEKSPKAFTDKKTTLKYAEIMYADGKLSQSDYEQIQKITMGQVKTDDRNR